MKEHDVVVLIEAIPEGYLKIGDEGTIVHIYPSGKLFEVEFKHDKYNKSRVLTLMQHQLKLKEI